MLDEGEMITSGIYPKGEIDLDKMIHSIKAHPSIDKAGSILTFTGIVRGFSMDKKPVKGMKIEAFIDFANKSIHDICEKISKREGIIHIILVHFIGEFTLNDDIVHIVVASSHREQGFMALRDSIDMYKKEVAVWKREEFYDETSEWV
jgi:molybdopterin synthase catalytic subunit